MAGSGTASLRADPPPGPADGSVVRLGDFATVDRRLLVLAGLGVLLGVVGALVAKALLLLIGLVTNLAYYGRFSFAFVSPAGNSLGLLALAVPVAGGLVVGLMARYGSERIRGHGIPEAIESILVNKSRIEPRVTVLKPASAAVSIGSGGPFGAEGPIIMTGGSVGSVFGQMLRLTASERKTLLVAGAAAGMAATFNTPVAAVLLAVELLLFEWRPRSLIPVGAASATAAVVRWYLLGPGALFPIPPTPSPDAVAILGAIGVGLAAGAAATLLTWAVYASEDAFRRLPVHWMWWPLLGGLAVGIGGLLVPRALGVGYDTIDALLLAQLAVGAVAALALVKGTIWAISLGSGTSGGVLAPLLLIGGSVGALAALVLPGGSVALWALVGMGAILGGTMRAPFTGVVFCLELTHDLAALPVLLVGALVADAVTVLTLRRSILTEKVARRGVHVAREYTVDPLERFPVRAVMRTAIAPAPAALPVRDLIPLHADPADPGSAYQLLDETGRSLGLLTQRQILAHLVGGGDPAAAAGGLLAPAPAVAYPDEPLGRAARRIAATGAEEIPVVDPVEPAIPVGLLRREDLFRAWVLLWREDQERERPLEPGRDWLGGDASRRIWSSLLRRFAPEPEAAPGPP